MAERSLPDTAVVARGPNDRARTSRTPAIALAVSTAALVALALAIHAATGALLPGERAFAEALQAAPGGGVLESIADVLALSLIEYSLLIAATVVAARARNYGLAFSVLLVLAARMTSTPLKELIERPRPQPGELTIREPAPGFGFPSGHAVTAVLVYGYAAAVALTHLPRRAALASTGLAASSVLLIGFDRIHDGAHWPSDVLGGFAIAAVLLACVLVFARFLGPRADLTGRRVLRRDA